MKFKATKNDLLQEENEILFKINEKFFPLRKSLKISPVAKGNESKSNSHLLEKIKVHQDRLS